MKLLGIEFHGFKSFADSADVRFHDGMTAIIGPNGCGKSNISDALRWVLGEQRPSAIRGSRMDEAIFQGTEKRKPIHRAEVTLRLSNEDNALPVPYSEVEIDRTVHRGGESEYRLNGTLCRLRDIQDLCRDTGLGTNAYAIIEGRMIDAILSDHAEERRQMFEEAAGIGRYKERRRVASRRLDEADGDLARINDLVSEVETKVRSLARQRGRARRYHELRERKLALEMALAESELARLQRRRIEIEAELDRIEKQTVTHTSQLRSAEAEHEATRTRLAELERERAASARLLMKARDRISEAEKERLLLQERARHARGRLEQVKVERAELAESRQALQAEVEDLARTRGDRAAVVDSMRRSLAEKEAELARLDERRGSLEAAAAAVEMEEQTYRETRANLQARAESERARADELASRIEGLRREESERASELGRVAAAADEAREDARDGRERLRSLGEELASVRAQLERHLSNREELRRRQAAASERLHAVRARIEEIEPLASGEQGLNPAVQAALERADELGIRAVLGRSIQASDELAGGVESYLGPLMEALVVADSEAVDRVRRWFNQDYNGPGGLVLLPLDRLPDRHAGPNLQGVRFQGDGAPWARYLLRGAGSDPAAEGGGVSIGRDFSVDAQGIVRMGQPLGRAGLVAHRAELEKLRSREGQLVRETESLTRDLETLGMEVSAGASRVEELEAERREAEEEAGRLAARAETEAGRLARSEEGLESTRATLATLEERRREAESGAEKAREELRGLKPAGAQEAPDPEELAGARAEWESLQEEVAELRVREARAAADTETIERDLEARRDAIEKASQRMEKLSEESAALAEALSEAEEGAEKLAGDLEELFEERTRCETESGQMEMAAEALREEVSAIESTLRDVQKRERQDSERRHELELERSELGSALKRVRERLEDEWGRPFDELAGEVEPAQGEGSELRAELTEVAEKLGRIGLVNMLAEQEYEEEKERLEFLREQREDLVKARDDLRETIRQINETASKALLETLDQIRENFTRTFTTLFQGGECDVWLEDPDDPLDSPIEISASPGGKKTQRIHLLSGGERALTALALLFAIYLVKPSPFCVLDEVDAPLDETNIRRFVAMLEGFKPEVQFIVITHNPVTIEAADWIYGVTMEEPGVSKIVGVEFSEYARGAVA